MIQHSQIQTEMIGLFAQNTKGKRKDHPHNFTNNEQTHSNSVKIREQTLQKLGKANATERKNGFMLFKTD